MREILEWWCVYGPLRLVSHGPIFTLSNRVVLTTGYLGRHVHTGADLSDCSVQPARLPVSLTPSTSLLQVRRSG